MNKEHYNLLTVSYMCFLQSNFTALLNAKKKYSGLKDIVFDFNVATINTLNDNITDPLLKDMPLITKFKIAKYFLDIYIKDVEYIANITGIYDLSDEDIDSLESENIDLITLNDNEIVKKYKTYVKN